MAKRNNAHSLFPKDIHKLIDDAPSPTQAANQFAELWTATGASGLNQIAAAYRPALFNLLGGSAFLSDVLIRENRHWPALFNRQVKLKQKSRANQIKELDKLVRSAETLDDFSAGLRKHKQREYLRIGTHDLMPSVTMEETVRELTALAEATLEGAYRFSRRQVEGDYGMLTLPDTDKPNGFVVLGMGKLGGGELNFSSDIDVIFFYDSDDGESSGGERGKADPRKFFSEVGKKIIQIMGEVTEEGFVFRIDLRLRPLGANGPLVQSMSSAMLYYESWGQCWERAALIKARPVAGDLDLGVAFLADVEPFVYRRYLDYTTVDELRHMKTRIENELLSGDEKLRNLKLGYGGIREIEFFTQALQLVNGGYHPTLRGVSTLPTLIELAALKLISTDERDQLTAAYRFLRQAEHKVQIMQEAHAHSIPEGKDEATAYARRLGYRRKGKYSELDLFWRDHKKYTESVRAIFDRLFYRAQKEIENEGASPGGAIWNELENEALVVRELGQAGFADPKSAYQNLLAVRDGEVYAPPSPKRLKLLRTLGPALISEIAKSGAPDQALLNLSKFCHRIGGRTGFLTLLTENPETMRLLIKLFADSQFLTDLFVNRPELIDTLIRGDLTHVEKTQEQMALELRSAVDESGDDIEAHLNALRRYKTEEFIRIGLHDLGGSVELLQVLSQLSDLAEACVSEALRLTLAELGEKFGAVKAGKFAIVGGGKMGAREIDYNSDLDLVFIYQAPEEAESRGGTHGSLPAHEFFVRVGQKLLTYLSAPTEEGIAYKIDMQLRPSGKAGPVVSSLDAYREYHRGASQLWERQALIKTRFICGDTELGRAVESIIESCAYGTGLPAGGKGEIHHLRMRMERELADEDDTRFNLKKGRGGLVDIEFVTQMLQLAHGFQHRELRRRATLEALRALSDTKIIKQHEFRLLADGYLFLRQLDHRLRLERDQSIDGFEADAERLGGIARALGYDSPSTAKSKRQSNSGKKLLRDYQIRREKIRSCYEKYFLDGD